MVGYEEFCTFCRLRFIFWITTLLSVEGLKSMIVGPRFINLRSNLSLEAHQKCRSIIRFAYQFRVKGMDLDHFLKVKKEGKIEKSICSLFQPVIYFWNN